MADSKNTQISCSLNSVFKCCKTKLVKHYVCINCFSVYHPSCIKRYSRQSTYLEGHLIICCGTTQKLQNDSIVLEDKVTKLTEEIVHKDNKIKSLNITEYTITREALEMEENVNLMIEEQKMIIKKLQCEIIALQKQVEMTLSVKKNVETQTNIVQKLSVNKMTNTNETLTDLFSDTEAYPNKIYEGKYNEINEENLTVSHVETEEELTKNKTISSETTLKKASEKRRQKRRKIINKKSKISPSQESKHSNSKKTRKMKTKKVKLVSTDRKKSKCLTNTDAKNTERNEQFVKSSCEEIIEALGKEELENNLLRTEKMKKNKLLIVGDESARGFACLLSKHLNNMIVDSNIKPNVNFLYLTKSMCDWSLNYGKNDAIVLVFNTINIANWKDLELAMKYLLGIGRSTNLIMISSREQLGDALIEKYIKNTIVKYCSRIRSCSINYTYNVKNNYYIMNWLGKKLIPSLLNGYSSNILLRTIKTDHIPIEKTPRTHFFPKLRNPDTLR